MKLPYTIKNIHGETLHFLRIVNRDGKEVLELENELTPGAGPVMHVHWKQDESLTVTEGEMTYQVKGEEPVTVGVGETITFTAGTYHKFWNSGQTMLKCSGWVSPPNTLTYFLGEIYKSIDENKGRPGAFDAAYLLRRYKSEYDMDEIPGFVKQFIFPITLFFGKLAGKHKKFANAPQPVV